MEKKKAKKRPKAAADWKKAARQHITDLNARNAFSLMELHAAINRHEKKNNNAADYLLPLYFKEYGSSKLFYWRPEQIEATAAFLQAIPDSSPLPVSQETLLFMVRKVLEMFYTHPRQVELDPLLLRLLAKKLVVIQKHEDSLVWLAFLHQQLTRRQAGKTDLRFCVEQWRHSLIPVVCKLDNQTKVLLMPPKTQHPRACHWFLDTPIPLLERWLQSMERFTGRHFFKLQLPTMDDIMQRFGREQASPVRMRLLERAFRVSASPVYLCWHDYGLPFPDALARIILEAPVLYYSEPAGQDFALLIDANRIPLHIREAFLMRSPKILRFNAASIVLRDLYLSQALYESCLSKWLAAVDPYLPKELFFHILAFYLIPTLELEQ